MYFCFIDYAKAFDCVDRNKLWEILQDMGITDHVTCLLKNPYSGQEATVRTGHGTTDWFQIGKGVHQAIYCHPAYLTSMYRKQVQQRKSRLHERHVKALSILLTRYLTTYDSWIKSRGNRKTVHIL